jgi:predicted membrane chloride channel (bestrophin family)
MILKKNFNPLKVISYVWRELLAATLVSGLVFWLYRQEVKTVALPFTPIGILGTALAIFLAFRNNASYARWWEARTIWANLLNSSRIFARQIVIAFVFATIERVGAVNENPFENKIQDVPLTAICRTIERDLKEQLGETDLPPKLEPENGYLY